MIDEDKVVQAFDKWIDQHSKELDREEYLEVLDFLGVVIQERKDAAMEDEEAFRND